MKADFEKKDISSLARQKIAVDMMNWVYQAYFSLMEFTGDSNMFILRYFERKVNALKKYNIELLFVVDGKTLPVKEITSAKRDEKRNWYLEKLNSSEDCTQEKMAVYEHYSTKITKELIYEIIDFLKFRGQEVMVSPYEADAQLSFLLRKGIVDYVMSEDSDMVAFGCRKIIKGFKIDGKCEVLRLPSATEIMDSDENSQSVLCDLFNMRLFIRS